MVALGCVRCACCESGRGCPRGIASTDPELMELMVRAGCEEAFAGRKLVELAPLATKAKPARISRCEVLRNAGDEVALNVSFSADAGEALSSVLAFDKTQIVEVRPAANMKGISVSCAVEYGVAPSFVGDDFILAPGQFGSAATLHVPAENVFLAGFPSRKRPGDADALEARYGKLFERIRSDFQRRFYNPATHMILNNGSCQAAHSAALCIGLVPDSDRAAVLQAIVDDLQRRNWQQTVGEVMQVFFVRALAEGGRNDVLHRVYAREDRGGYGYMVRQGLTTLPESWDAKPGTGNSMNHFMLGHLMEWHFAYVAGIRQQSGGFGWRRVLIAPIPGPLASAEGAFDSPAGMIRVRWERKGDDFRLRATVPEGIEATAVMPGGNPQALAPGTTELRSTIN